MSDHILVHPDVYDKFVAQFQPAKKVDNRLWPIVPLGGVPVHVSRLATCFAPPDDPFIEYEPSDYGWLERLGYGKRVPGVIVMNQPTLTAKESP